MISGEIFQTLSQISFCSSRNCIIDDQLKQISQNVHNINDFDTSKIKEYNIIFCYTHDVELFFERFSNFLNDNTIIITHNSDIGIDERHLKYIDLPQIKKWFCQNRYINHPKLVSLPIGIANSQWPHGNGSLLAEVKNKNTQKEFLVYKNFDIGTNSYERTLCNVQTNEIPLSSRTQIHQYWENIAKSMFVISPPGNGVDCHRIWECLYLKTVPIVKYHETFSQFKHLPILFIGDWKQVTVDFLKNEASRFANQSFDLLELDASYWRKLIVIE